MLLVDCPDVNLFLSLLPRDEDGTRLVQVHRHNSLGETVVHENLIAEEIPKLEGALGGQDQAF